MKLVHYELQSSLLSENMPVCEWIIESLQLFSKYVQELFAQYTGREGSFVLSSKENEVNIAKYTEIIFNPFSVDINDKKILNKLYADLSRRAVAEEFFAKTRSLMQGVNEYLLDLEQSTEYILDIDSELDLTGLFKISGIKFEGFEEDFLERLVRYIKVIACVLEIKLIVFVNVRSYLDKNQVESLIKESLRQEVNMLLIENQEKDCLKGCFRYIIDSDGCEIF